MERLAQHTWVVAAASLVLGFVVAQATGVRPLGGIVLLAGGVWCWRTWRRDHGTGLASALILLAFVLFVLSHVLAGPLGTWGAVALVAAVAAGAAWWWADRPGASAGSRERLPATMGA